MLKRIPAVLSPRLVALMMEMGHGDEIVLGDCNFPAASIASGWGAERLVRADGLDIPVLLEAIMQLFPLDQSVVENAVLMAIPPQNSDCAFIHDIYRKTVGEGARYSLLAKPDFYQRARNCYAAVATGERRRFANIILRKGIVNIDE